MRLLLVVLLKSRDFSPEIFTIPLRREAMSKGGEQHVQNAFKLPGKTSGHTREPRASGE